MAKTKAKPAVLDHAAIIKRGYALDEEYKLMGAKLSNLEKLDLCVSGDHEHLWVYPLEPSGKAGTKFHFVFHNDPVYIRGPRPVAGLVGIATSNGPKARASATSADCYKLFEATSDASLKYWESVIKAERSKKNKETALAA